MTLMRSALMVADLFDFICAYQRRFSAISVPQSVWTSNASRETLEFAPALILFRRSNSTPGWLGHTGRPGEMPRVKSMSVIKTLGECGDYRPGLDRFKINALCSFSKSHWRNVCKNVLTLRVQEVYTTNASM